MVVQKSFDLIRVMIIDDHPVVRNGLAMMLKYEPGMELVAEASNGQQAIALFGQYQPDVTLIDLKMPEMSGIDAIAAIRDSFADARFIILTTYDGDEDIHRGLQAGAKAYLLKDSPSEEILATIRKVYGGKSHIPTEVGAKLAERMQCENLSVREIEVVQLMAQGKSNREIGEVLKITEGTVKYHVNNILSKLQVNDRTQAVITVLKRGIASF